MHKIRLLKLTIFLLGLFVFLNESNFSDSTPFKDLKAKYESNGDAEKPETKKKPPAVPVKRFKADKEKVELETEPENKSENKVQNLREKLGSIIGKTYGKIRPLSEIISSSAKASDEAEEDAGEDKKSSNSKKPATTHEIESSADSAAKTENDAESAFPIPKTEMLKGFSRPSPPKKLKQISLASSEAKEKSK